jgi:DNA invertase Pin-like site-specific DNA recombinase
MGSPRVRQNKRSRPLALGYVRVSTDEQAHSGGSLAGQETALRKHADNQGWDIEIISEPGVSGKSLTARPGITAALLRLSRGEADHLLAIGMDRISRSVRDVADLMDRSVRERWGLVTIRENVDTSTAMGRAMAQMAGVMAELERGLISERTKAGMAAKRAAGGPTPGRRPTLASLVPAMRAAELKAAGVPLSEIGMTLADEGWLTGSGRDLWTESSVRSALRVARYGRAEAA